MTRRRVVGAFKRLSIGLTNRVDLPTMRLPLLLEPIISLV